jgi:Tol biopolymer transport system component
MLKAKSALRIVLVALLVAPVLTVQTGANAAWPGRNGKILFTSARDGDYDIYVMSPSGGSVVNLSQNDTFNEQFSAFSPNGKKVAFTTDRDGNNEIYVMNANGTNPQRLTNDPGTDATPQWSPNGKKIAFTSDRDGDFEIYTMNSSGGNLQQLTNNAAPDPDTGPLDAFPAYSPNGKKILFTSNRDGNSEIYTMRPNGLTQANITNNSAEDQIASWSPDGKRIAFDSDRDTDREIFTMNPNGSGVTQITNNTVTDAFPQWSPQGDKITFTSSRDNTTSADIYVMNANGTAVQRLNDNSGVEDVPMDWQALAAPRSLSIRSNRSRVDRGDRVRLSGDLDGVASCIGDQKIQLQSRPPGGGKFKKTGSTRTDADGDYELQERVNSSRQFRAVAPAFGQCKKDVSNKTTVQVR